METLKAIGEWFVNFFDSLDGMSQAVLIFFIGVVAFLFLAIIAYHVVATRRDINKIILKQQERKQAVERAKKLRREREDRIRNQY